MNDSNNTNRSTENYQSTNSDIGVRKLLLQQIGNGKHEEKLQNVCFADELQINAKLRTILFWK